MNEYKPYIYPIVVGLVIQYANKIQDIDIFNVTYKLVISLILIICCGIYYYYYYYCYYHKYKNTITISAIITYTTGYATNMIMNDDYKSITYKLFQHKKCISKIIKNTNKNTNTDIDNKLFDNKTYVLNKYASLCLLNNYIKIENIIIYTNVKKEESSGSSNTRTVIIYEYIICSNTLSCEQLYQTLIDWENEYINVVRLLSSDIDKMCFNLINCDNTPESWIIKPFISHMNFNHLFFNEKQDLLQKLDRFMNNEEYYISSAMPRTFGLLLCGESGCGKTSTIKSIANYTNRHIINIDLSKIKTCKQLINIFYNDKMNNIQIPIDKKIIVFEDIDCMIDIVLERSITNNKNNDEVVDDIVIIDDTNNDKKNDGNFLDNIFKNIMKKQRNTDDKLNLSCILNLIDGIIEQPGRILIITTNYPDRLDKALIRHGRIDMKIIYTKVSADNIIHYTKDKFGTISNELKIKIADKFTPLELRDIIESSNNINDFETKIKLV